MPRESDTVHEDSIPSVDFRCQFDGRIVRAADSPQLTRCLDQLQPLLEHAVIVELSNYSHFDQDVLSSEPRKANDKFYIILCIKDLTGKTFTFLKKARRATLTPGYGVSCLGTVYGQLGGDFVARAYGGHENNIPMKQYPILLVAPTGFLRVTKTPRALVPLDAQDVQSPSGQGYEAMMGRLHAWKALKPVVKSFRLTSYGDECIQFPFGRKHAANMQRLCAQKAQNCGVGSNGQAETPANQIADELELPNSQSTVAASDASEEGDTTTPTPGPTQASRVETKTDETWSVITGNTQLPQFKRKAEDFDDSKRGNPAFNVMS